VAKRRSFAHHGEHHCAPPSHFNANRASDVAGQPPPRFGITLVRQRMRRGSRSPSYVSARIGQRQNATSGSGVRRQV